MAVDRLSMQFYSSLHPRGPHVQGIQFYLGNPGLEHAERCWRRNTGLVPKGAERNKIKNIKIVETRGADKPAVSSDTLEGLVCSLPNLSSLLKQLA